VIASLFVSDLHLDPARPRATAAFLRFLKSDARRAGRLFILGDLFEFWIGDDSDDDLSGDVLGALAEFTAAGHECLLMRGNRDFLIGAGFEAQTGSRIIEDPSLQDMFGERVLIMHGDLLCTGDRAYQRYRRIVHNPLLQRLFLSLPRSWRRAAGAEGRRRSRRYASARGPDIADVNQDTVCTALARSGARVLLHGHTHRPGIHHFHVNGIPAVRIVLGDWYEQGSVLRWSAAGYELTSLPFR
jgi:UDP-2,3-diacylglucosamine hydrolase